MDKEDVLWFLFYWSSLVIVYMLVKLAIVLCLMSASLKKKRAVTRSR